MMGAQPYVRPEVDARAHPTRLSLARRASGSSCAAARGRSTAGAYVTPVGGHGSHLIGDLAEADALIVRARGRDRRSTAGETVTVLLLDEEF